jgi:hypothetical protein
MAVENYKARREFPDPHAAVRDDARQLPIEAIAA